MKVTPSLNIETPEGVHFRLTLASPLLRGLAWFIDLFVISVLTQLVALTLTLVQVISMDAYQALSLLAGFVLSIGYSIIMEWAWRGQTIGKRLFHLRVMDEEGLRLHFSQVVMRNLLRALDILPPFYGIGALCATCSSKMQRLGDIAAGTIVVWSPPLSTPDLDQLMAGKFNSFRGHRILEARLRKNIPAEEARLALQAIVRRDQFEDLARVRLFEQLIRYWNGRISLPEDLTRGLTDEQITRNIVDILFRTQAG
jgi:uncharacterized RDD family membrane protein YckC